MNRQDVVTAAREWIDTPFHHQARLKGVGVDCVGLVIGVARELALVPESVSAAPSTCFLLQTVCQLCVE